MVVAAQLGPSGRAINEERQISAEHPISEEHTTSEERQINEEHPISEDIKDGPFHVEAMEREIGGNIQSRRWRMILIQSQHLGFLSEYKVYLS